MAYFKQEDSKVESESPQAAARRRDEEGKQKYKAQEQTKTQIGEYHNLAMLLWRDRQR